MTAESFSSVAVCPHCSAVDTHWLTEPRYAPTGDSPLARTYQQLNAVMEAFSTITSGTSTPFFDEPEATVARICRSCGHRWGQR